MRRDGERPSGSRAPEGSSGRSEASDRAAANKAIGVSALGLALTGALELAVALFSGSVALLGDALHNLADVSTSGVVFLGFWISRRPASDAHPYGYDRAEDLAGLGVVLVIWASAIFAGIESYRKLAGPTSTGHVVVGMAGALAGVLGNQAVAVYKRRVGRRIGSATMLAEATHSWLDAASSVGALVGLALVAAGFSWGDPAAGFAVTLFIVHVGYEVTRELLSHLTDGLDPGQVAAARAAAAGVTGVGQVRVYGRWAGRCLRLEVETSLDPALPLSDADALASRVEAAVAGAVPAARRVHCHGHADLPGG